MYLRLNIPKTELQILSHQSYSFQKIHHFNWCQLHAFKSSGQKPDSSFTHLSLPFYFRSLSLSTQSLLALPWKHIQNPTNSHHLHIASLVPDTIICFLDYYRSSCFCSCIIITIQHAKWSCKNLAVPLPRTLDPQIYWHGSFSNLFQVFLQMCSQWCLLWCNDLKLSSFHAFSSIAFTTI